MNYNYIVWKLIMATMSVVLFVSIVYASKGLSRLARIFDTDFFHMGRECKTCN